ncbi:unnamed protein product [Polarella glacialis]|uniref:Glycoside hydrolase family 5 domain-containing protein n=1 Tax=Polarella glacialis TaxID=89957 RepID=A0A813D6I8_POLGL|nr:unnamed protein product [Polarella glacialis]
MLRSLRLLLSSASLSLPAAFFPSEAVTTTPTTTITTITTTTTARSIPGAPLAPGLGGPHAWLVPKSELPLHTEGRYIAGRGGERVKWACVNWYGAYSETMTPGGLEVRPLDQIVARIVELGFNCVRLCYSTQAQLENPILRKEDLLMNPDLWGKRFLDVWDATVSAITDKGLMLIVNNQVHKSGWCCHWTQDEGLWYVPGYPESVWIESLVNMTLRHRANPLVVAIDLRNEVHDYQGVSLTWGDGNPDTDWAGAAARAGNAVLAANPDVLVVVMALCFGMDLRAMRDAPLELDIPHRVVYQTHNYLEYQLWSLISQGFVSWRTISLGTGFSAAAVAIVLVALIAAWIRLGKPWPVLPSLVVTFGSWLSVLTLVGVAICQACLFIVTQAPGCGSWGRRDVVPARNWLLVFAALGALLAIFGVLLCMRLRPAASVVGSAAADGSSHEEDDEDGSLDSDTEDNTSHEPAGGYKSCIRRLCGSSSSEHLLLQFFVFRCCCCCCCFFLCFFLLLLPLLLL